MRYCLLLRGFYPFVEHNLILCKFLSLAEFAELLLMTYIYDIHTKSLYENENKILLEHYKSACKLLIANG